MKTRQMNNQKIYSLLGLATRARATVSGEFSVNKSLKEGKATLVLVAEDASANTHKEFADACAYRKVAFYEFGTKDELGRCMGKEERAVAAIVDGGFAKSIMKLLMEE